VIALNTQRTRAFDRTEWRYFVLDSSTRFPLAAISASVLSSKLSLMDRAGKAVAVERFATSFDSDYDSYYVNLVVVANHHRTRNTTDSSMATATKGKPRVLQTILLKTSR